MFKNLRNDLDQLLDAYDKEQEAGCEPGQSTVFFDTMQYMNSQSKIKLLLFYLYTFVKSKGKQYRQCYLPLKLSYKLYAMCYFRIFFNRFKRRLGL
jgi:hypothetical protein